MQNTDLKSYRFSGHDTFHCREQWLIKGVQLADNVGLIPFADYEDSTYKLGVGKNMVRSVVYWIRAFDLINTDEANLFTEHARFLFTEEKADKYLEDTNSLYLLQYLISSKEHASMYSLIFNEYFKDKAILEFSEYQITTYIHRLLKREGINKFTENTIRADFKVFLKNYLPPKKNLKTLEDDFSAPLIKLNLIQDSGRRNDLNQPIFYVNRRIREDLSEYIFAYCLLDYFPEFSSFNVDDVINKLGAFLCLTPEGVEEIIDRLCAKDKRFVYKTDAGLKVLQIKNPNPTLKTEFLKAAYEL